MNWQEFINPELLILIPVLYLIGTAIRKSSLANKWIPFVLGFVAVLLASLYVFATTDINGSREIALALFTSVTQGVLIAGASVYANQLVTQFKKEE
jgi:hypothetical protein